MLHDVVVVMMGAAGAGKTTVGRALATSLGWPFVEGDDYHSAAAVEKIRGGIGLTDADRLPWLASLQGRFPIRVELEALGRDEFVRILTEPRSALVKQYMALMATEGITLTFTPDAIERIADFATRVNERTENIGARRLHTVMEKLLDEISFEGPDLEVKTVTIDDAYVTRMLADIVKNEDLSRYIL